MKKEYFPIKAQLVTYDREGKEIKKRKTLRCWCAYNERIPVIEVTLTPDGKEVQQSIYVDLKSLMKEVKQYEASK